jgi:hypothetical protein
LEWCDKIGYCEERKENRYSQYCVTPTHNYIRSNLSTMIEFE